MKNLRFHLLLVCVLLLQTCGKPASKPLGTPQQTFEALVEAIQNKDLDAYEACWYPGMAEEQGMIAKIKEDAGKWAELALMFKGSLKLSLKFEYFNSGIKLKNFAVEAPEVPKEAGVGNITMALDGDVWKMYAW